MSDEEVYEKLTGDSIRSVKKKSRGNEPSPIERDELNEEDFYSAVSESASKLIIHYGGLTKKILAAGDMQTTLGVYAGLALMRNKLWHYNEHLEVNGARRAFFDEYSETVSLLESAAEHVAEYHSSVIATSIVHDPAGDDWTNERPFYEGEKVSHAIQMWWYTLQGLRNDLWSTSPPKMAKKVLGSVFDQSLGLLVTRYANVRPSEARVPQFRGDVSAILLASAEALAWFATDVSSIMNSIDCGVISSVHAKCRHLVAILAAVSSPHDEFTAAVSAAEKKFKKRKSTSLTHGEVSTAWVTVLQDGGGGGKNTNSKIDLASDHASSGNAVNVGMIAKMVASSAEPNWPLLVQLTLSREMAVARTVIVHLGAFVPGSVNGDHHKAQDGGGEVGCCGGFQCSGDCFGGAADDYWPHDVCAAVLSLCAEAALGGRDTLVRVLDPLLLKMGDKASFACMDRFAAPPYSVIH